MRWARMYFAFYVAYILLQGNSIIEKSELEIDRFESESKRLNNRTFPPPLQSTQENKTAWKG
jgi:hypothetical protein